MIRAFVALPLPDDIRASLRLLQARLPMPATVDEADFHLTLAFLGEQPDHVLQDIHEGLSELRMPPFTLELAAVNCFGGAKPRVVWAGVAPSEALSRLQAKVAQVVVRAGVHAQAKGYAPHVTLARLHAPDPDTVARLSAAMAMRQDYRAGPWQVSEFALYASHPRSRGPKYEVLTSYPLS
jgi:2'-5' RNA ligase